MAAGADSDQDEEIEEMFGKEEASNPQGQQTNAQTDENFSKVSVKNQTLQA